MICDAKHIPEIPDDELRCPKCDAGCGDWYIEGTHNEDCERISPDDLLFCAICQHSESAGTWVKRWKRWKKSKSLVTCPYCKGTGVVDEGKHINQETKP